MLSQASEASCPLKKVRQNGWLLQGDLLLRLTDRLDSTKCGGRSSAGRAQDCDSCGRGFESHRPPQCGSGEIGRHARFRF